MTVVLLLDNFFPDGMNCELSFKTAPQAGKILKFVTFFLLREVPILIISRATIIISSLGQLPLFARETCK